MYKLWSNYVNNRYDEAWESYLKGIQIKADPIQRLTQNYHGLKTRIKDIISQGLIKTREEEEKRRINESIFSVFGK